MDRRGYLHPQAVLQQPVEVAVGVDGDLLGAILRKLRGGPRIGVGRQAGFSATSAARRLRAKITWDSLSRPSLPSSPKVSAYWLLKLQPKEVSRSIAGISTSASSP